MSTNLTVDRLSATVLATDRDDADRAVGVLGRVVGAGLESALRSVSLPAGTWYVRRHRTVVPLAAQESESDPVLAEHWARALVTSLEEALRTGGEGIVRYDNEIETAVDAVAGITAGRLGRLWAWQQAGILDCQSPDPLREPGAAMLAVLRKKPGSAARVLSASAALVSLPGLDRVLGETGWTAAAEVVRGGPEHLDPGDREAAPAALTRVLAHRLLSASPLAALIVRGKVRPTEATLRAWGVLVAEDADPVAACRAGVAAAVASELRRTIRGDTVGRPAPEGHARTLGGSSRPPSDRSTPEAGSRGLALPHGPGGTRDTSTSVVPASGAAVTHGGPPTAATRSPAAGDEPSVTSGTGVLPARTRTGHAGEDEGEAGAQGEMTQHGGLFFLLATAATAGLPGSASRGALAARPVPWVVHQAVQRMGLGLDASDPAALGIAGLDRRRGRWLLAADPADDLEDELLHTLAAQWSEVTLARLAEARTDHSGVVGSGDHEPVLDLPWLVRRTASVLAYPTWVEAVFGLGLADGLVRRSGLDLDPGWVPWLGCVVRYRYE